MQIEHIYISAGHNYFGHKGLPPGTHPAVEVDAVECVAGRGIRNDRYFDYKDDYKGQITFFSAQVFQQLCDHFQIYDKAPWVLRRNVVTSGQDLNELIGREFELQGVLFLGTEESRPCFWMEQAFAPGTKEFLQGRGGLRARILRDGMLRVTAAHTAAV